MQLQTIAHTSSPYKQKFAIPRQPGLVREARGELLFTPEFSNPDCLRGLEQFSHIWVLFLFHETAARGWSPLVQPPRLGGKTGMGVFATRSTFRPNPLGLSVLENLGWDRQGKQLILKVGGLDLLEGTPIVDIKPYLPYADALADARAGYATLAPHSNFRVVFSEASRQSLAELQGEYPDLESFITGVLEQDPRPAWRQKPGDERQYGMNLYDLNIKWRLEEDRLLVLSIQREAPAG